MKTLVLANQKGGVGKSAVATLLAHHLAQQGRRVLALDLDHQGNLSQPLTRSGRTTLAPFGADQLMTEAGHRLQEQSQVQAQAITLVPAGPALLGMERQPTRHNEFANRLHDFLQAHDQRFDVCLVDTNPNPDIRVIAALACADHVLSPIQLNQEALEGVGALLNHPRVGIRKVQAVLNPRLDFIGLLPTMVEATPFQKANWLQLVQRYPQLMVRIGDGPGQYAALPRRASIAEAQASGEVLWEMKKTAARDAWREIEPSLRHIAGILTAVGVHHGLAA